MAGMRRPQEGAPCPPVATVLQPGAEVEMAYSTEIPVDRLPRGTNFPKCAHFEERNPLSPAKPLRGLSFGLIWRRTDPRPINPMAESERRILIFDPVTGQTFCGAPPGDLRFIPARVVHFRGICTQSRP